MTGDLAVGSERLPVISSLLNDVKFQAFLAVDIMDRNLYERANDVRWWALTSSFRSIMEQPNIQNQDKVRLNSILTYINDLYTVYTNIFIFDQDGFVIAVSNSDESGLVDNKLADDNMVRAALSVNDSQKYAVTPFINTELYNHRHTYIYLSSIRSITAKERIVGGIGIVFDSEPQFKAMLEDALPRDNNGTAIAGAFGLFINRDKQIISSTTDSLKVGEFLEIESDILNLENGERTSIILDLNQKRYAVGAVMSQGYREYKTTGDYENDILALIFVPI